MARRKKITVQTDNSNWQAPKVRKKRKPMTEEQRVAAAARLEKAREKRKEKNPDYGHGGVSTSLRDLPDDHMLHPKKIKEWIKTQKDLASSVRGEVRQKVKGAEARLLIHEGYIKNMQKYLRDGDWIDDFYGEHQQHKIRWRCIALAYNDDGTPIRSVGVYYPDMGCVYTQEMFNEEKGISNGEPKKRKRKDKRQRNTGPVAKVKKKG
tara:strand:- start:383 stop:1006 length:624 start_codon:yes stop_codon:yes gene_type:complete